MPAGHHPEFGTITTEDVPVPRVDIELTDPPDELRLINATPRFRKILALIRLHDHPLGTVVLDGTGDLAWQEHAPMVWSAMSDAVNAHLLADGLPPASNADALRIDMPQVDMPQDPACVSRRRSVLANAPRITVIVATRERPQYLRECLNSLLQMDYPAYEILVVDNDPISDETARMVAEKYRANVRYLREMRRGLAWAHNRGLKEVETHIVAFTDDDVIVDRHWLTGIAEGFAAHSDVACVTGLILSEQLDTPAQLLLHQHGGFDKGFTQRAFGVGRDQPPDPLFPFSAGKLGSGANMAFTADALREHGGFDPALGMGTRTCGGDELAAFFRIVLKYRLVYEPAAIVWHRHHREITALRNQAANFGVGTGAFLTSVMIHEPKMWGPLLSRLPAGVASLLNSRSTDQLLRYDGWLKELKRFEKRRIFYGPIRYAQSRWHVRKLLKQDDEIVG